jgi:uncharacterized protein YgiM (DUF1202 family)
MCFFRALAVASFCLSLSAHLSSAQEATANRGVNLRSDPSTKNPPIGHLNAGETVTLLSETPKASFYHVKTSDGTEGWVGKKYLTVGQPSATGPSSTSHPLHQPVIHTRTKTASRLRKRAGLAQLLLSIVRL